MKLRQDKENLVRELKKELCVDCGGSFHFSSMDFDHVRGEKLTEISKMISKTFSIETLINEIEKCDLVCANCHRFRTWKRKQENA